MISQYFTGAECGSSYQNKRVEHLSFFRRERGDDFLEAWIAAQGVPIGVETEFAISRPARAFANYVQLFQGEILLTGECVDSGEIREQQHTTDGILCRRKHVASGAALPDCFLFVA